MTRAPIFAAVFLLAIPASAGLFVGDPGGRETYVFLSDTPRSELLGASLRTTDTTLSFVAPELELRLLTGRRDGDRVELREWEGPGRPGASISGRIVRRRWTGGEYEAELRTRWRGRKADFVYETPTAAGDANHLSAAVIDRLHAAIRDARWDEAMHHAKLACVVNEQECVWIGALPDLASGRTPPVTQYAPWTPLLHERAGRWREALTSARVLCSRYSRMGCQFYADLATRPKVNAREVYHFTCRQKLVRCEAYWGANEIALIDALRSGDEPRVERLLRSGVNVNFGGEELLPTPLTAAVWSGSVPLVMRLLAAGADARRTDYSDTAWLSPLFYAINDDNEDLALLLLARGAPIHPKRDQWQGDENLLSEAARRGLRRVVHAMLEAGEPPDDWPFEIGTPLHIAADNGDVAMVKDLLAHGADPDRSYKTSRGSPIDHARARGRKQILRLLLAARKESS